MTPTRALQPLGGKRSYAVLRKGRRKAGGTLKAKALLRRMDKAKMLNRVGER